MKRFLFAAVMIAAFGSSAVAQVPGTTLPPPTATPVQTVPLPPFPPASYYPNVNVPPGAPPGPAIPFFKSGGVVAGAYGYYPYDTGNWLLGGTQGLTRQTGSFTMVFPGAPPVAGGDAPVVTEAPAARSHSLFKRKLFCR